MKRIPILALALAFALFGALALTGCGKGDACKVRITVPASTSEDFAYSDEEISPAGNRMTIWSGDGLGDTEVVLKPIEVTEENAYDEPTYLTPGMPVEMDVEKGAWFKIGVAVQNEADADLDVYVEVEGVRDLRIAESSYELSD